MTKLESRKNEVWMIWPEDAKRLLAMNYKHNRPVGIQTVTKYANDMRNGKWGDTPSPLIITTGGVLLDGQHRLSAVIEAGVPIVFEVRIVPDDMLFQYIDNGKARKITDFVNTKNKFVVSSVAMFAYCAQYGEQGISGCYDGNLRSLSVNGKSVKVRADRSGVANYANTHADGLSAIALQAVKMYRAAGCISKKTYSVVLWLLKMFNDVDLTDEFVDEFSKLCPDSKSIYAGKAAIMRAANDKTKIDETWAIGMLLDMYHKFVDCSSVTRFTSWKTTYEKYEKAIQEKRKKNDTEG